jgi:hypothetical protein
MTDKDIEKLKEEFEKFENSWIPIKTRPLTEEEKEEYPEATFMYDCPMPDDGEEVLIKTQHGYIYIDIFISDGCGGGGWYYEEFCDDDDGEVVAWAPKPKPYKEGNQ